MIKTKTVEQTIIGTNIKHYKNLGYSEKPFEKIIIPVEHLPKNSRCIIEVICKCGKISKMRFEHYNKCCSNQGYYACIKCCKNKSIKTSKERYGVEHYSQTEESKKKIQNTNLKKYGVNSVLKNPIFLEKMKKTNKKKYGVEYVSQLEEVKNKKKDTSHKNFGVDSHMKTEAGLRKNQLSNFRIKKYKNTNLYYQGTYELYFLENIEKIGFINELNNGKQYKYIFNEKQHTYHSDFYFQESTIEIKSSWTYNKNGKDKNLQKINETKWEAVRKCGDKIIILKSKEEINKFIKKITKAKSEQI